MAKAAATKTGATKTRARAKPRTKAKAEPMVEELYFRTESAYLCLLLNRRTKFIRVVDFRVGAIPAKRLYIQSVAKREGVKKVITLVEKDEVSSWTRVGFVREGTVPGFYKRSDGHLCGCVIGDKTASVTVSDAGVKLSERTLNAAKKAAKDVSDKIRGSSFHELNEKDALKERDRIWKKGSPLGSFESFGRDATRLYYDASYKRSKTHTLSAEYQDCFGHSLIEILEAPRSKNEIVAIVEALRRIGEALREFDIVSMFSFAPSDDEQLATAFIAAGYRRTGLLASALEVDGERKDAILFTQKMLMPGEENA
ncbi:MAG: hypothetical protein GXP55_04010 [Deltaproteobacteria bacterium]|nr:hypothetical protein [Deltaproteobacteria bacterium]